MAENETIPVELKKPLSGWEKFKVGVKGFFKTAIDYLPRGILFAAMFFGASALLGSIGLWDPLGALAEGGTFHMAHAAHVIGKSALLGVLISGGVGAWQTIVMENTQRETEIVAQAEQIKRCREFARTREPEQEYVAAYTPENTPAVNTSRNINRARPAQVTL